MSCEKEKAVGFTVTTKCISTLTQPWFRCTMMEWWRDPQLKKPKITPGPCPRKKIRYLTPTTKKEKKHVMFPKKNISQKLHLSFIIYQSNIGALGWWFRCKKLRVLESSSKPPKVPYKTKLFVRVCYMWKLFSVPLIKFSLNTEMISPFFPADLLTSSFWSP